MAILAPYAIFIVNVCNVEEQIDCLLLLVDVILDFMMIKYNQIVKVKYKKLKKLLK